MRRALLGALCALFLSTSARAQLTIRLTSVPAGTPAGAVHVAGSFNGWAPGDPGSVLVRQPDGAFTITLPDSVRGTVEFKFTRGSWDAVETGASGGDVANRRVVVPPTGAMTFVGTVAGWRSASDSAAPRRSTASRSVRVLSDSFAIPELGRARRVWVRLPRGYATSTARYPVLYMHDGQNVFDAATSFAGEWGVDETLDSLEARGGRGAIVVAVDNGGEHRMDEYDPWKSADPKLGGGEGDAYVDFLVRTLKPYVDAHFRTRPDARHTAILGSSMGGLISLYAALEHPDVFGRAGVFSCACWVAGPRIMTLARRATPAAASRLYFVSGAFETKEGQPATEQRLVVDSLAAAGFRRGTMLRSVIVPDGKHAEWFWRREFPAAYAWLLGDR